MVAGTHLIDVRTAIEQRGRGFDIAFTHGQ